MNKLTSSLAAMLTLCSVVKGQTPATKSPNVLFILADDLGWRDTSVYGSTFYRTPNIDRLAGSGMRFTGAVAANPLCSPTRAGILTGQYPVRLGLTTASGHVAEMQEHRERQTGPEDVRGIGPSSLNYLDPKHYTLSKALKDAGYATGFFGKWHMGSRREHWPENHGFDFVRGGREHPGPPGKDPQRRYFPPWSCDTLDSNVPADTHVDDLLTSNAIDYMKQQQKNGKPFFVCYWAYSVHSPYQSKPELIAKWKPKADLQNPQHSPTMAAMIEVLDDNVGRLLQALEDTGLAENTIVIFTSDNGGNMYDTVDGTTPTNNHPLRNGKANNYDGGVRVPLIVRWPGVTKPGTVNPAVVSSVDHYPALLEMTGQPLRPADHKDGVSYVPALRGQEFDRGVTICDMPHRVGATGNIPNTSVRMGDWKLYRFWYDNPADQSHRYELYNVKDDIGETKDLAGANPEELQKMIAALDAYYKETGVLTYHPNRQYNKRTVGTWFAASEGGRIAGKDGVLVLESVTVNNRCFPPGAREGWLVFEARATKPVSLNFAGPGKGTSVAVTPEWKQYELSGKQVFLTADKFSLHLTEPGQTELRNVRVLTPDKTTEMMRYQFY